MKNPKSMKQKEISQRMSWVVREINKQGQKMVGRKVWDDIGKRVWDPIRDQTLNAEIRMDLDSQVLDELENF